MVDKGESAVPTGFVAGRADTETASKTAFIKRLQRRKSRSVAQQTRFPQRRQGKTAVGKAACS
jgi:hypothetical protein